MDLTSEHPFWLVKNGLLASYPFLDADQSVEIVVVGAGISGAMIAQRLAEEGFSLIVLDRRDVCTGSTAASTALLQYEIDLPLLKMSEIIGREMAERAYLVSHRSIDDIENLVARLGIECEFQRRTSIYLADDRKRAKLLADEARARKSIGLDVRYNDHGQLADRFGLNGVAALSSSQAASCDAHRLAHGLLQNAVKHGAQVFDRTQVTKVESTGGSVVLATNRGPQLTAKVVIFATGYESQKLLKERVVNLDNTYAVVSQPLATAQGWDEDWMLWEAKEPYLYLRMTGDRRLLVGGEDDAFHSPVRRDASVAAKARIIESKVRKLVPQLEWEIEFAWAGTFGSTKDGLAYIGGTEEYPGCLFSLGFGGNGITFSSIAANLLSRMVRGETAEDGDLFRFSR